MIYLQNAGLAPIAYAKTAKGKDVYFQPGTSLKFDETDADQAAIVKKLMRLYPKTVKDLQAADAAISTAAAAVEASAAPAIAAPAADATASLKTDKKSASGKDL